MTIQWNLIYPGPTYPDYWLTESQNDRSIRVVTTLLGLLKCSFTMMTYAQFQIYGPSLVPMGSNS